MPAEKLKNLIEDYMEFLENAQAVYRGQTGVDYVRPLRLAPRKRKEAPEPTIREHIGRIQNEIEAIANKCGASPDEFTDCVDCVIRDCEEMLLQIEIFEERTIDVDPPTWLPDRFEGALAVKTEYVETGSEGS